MNEDRAAFGGDARLFIEDCRAFCLHVGEGGVDVGYFQADMVQALAAFLQEFCEAGVGGEGLDQFNFAATRATHRQKGDAHLLGRHLFYLARRDAQKVTIEEQGLLDVTHYDSNMVDALRHRFLRFPERALMDCGPLWRATWRPRGSPLLYDACSLFSSMVVAT